MSSTEIATRSDGIRSRLQRLLNDKIPFEHYSVGTLLDAAWEVGRALEVQNDPNPYELWEGILIAYGERA